jgi:hypothetical protein
MTLQLSDSDAALLGYTQSGTAIPEFEETYISDEEEYTVMVLDSRGNRQPEIEEDIIEVINSI